MIGVNIFMGDLGVKAKVGMNLSGELEACLSACPALLKHSLTLPCPQRRWKGIGSLRGSCLVEFRLNCNDKQLPVPCFKAELNPIESTPILRLTDRVLS